MHTLGLTEPYYLTQRHPLETSKDRWPTLRQDVRQYTQSCVTCQKMTTRNQIIRTSRFVTSTLKPMQRIAMDTMGPFLEAVTFKFIIVLIDTFTRYVELFPSQTVSAASAAIALRYICRFCTPIEIITDRGTQFMNQILTHLTTTSGFRHHHSIPYS